MISKSIVAAAVACVMSVGAMAQTVDNWVSASGGAVRSGANLCWRDASWTPATAAPECDGAIAKVTLPAKIEAPVEVPKTAVAPEAPAVKQAVSMHYTAAADVFFDFDRTTLKPEGKKILTQLAAEIAKIDLEIVVSSGHTDGVGSKAYNMKLSERRAMAVRAFLVSQGVDKNRVVVHAFGKSKPVATNKTAAGRAKNRRVEIEIVGSKR